MTHIIKHFGMATTAIAAVLALSTTPSFAQDTGTPPDPVADTSVQTPASADPLAPEPVADDSPVAADTPVPPAAKPKVEKRTAVRQPVKAAPSRPAASSTVRRVSATATAPAAAPAAAEPIVPAPLPAEPQQPVAAAPTAPPVAEPVPASDTSDGLMSDFMAEPMLPIAGAAALGLIALGGAGIVMKRRRRRREDEEFEARQRALDMAEAEATPEPSPGCRSPSRSGLRADVRRPHSRSGSGQGQLGGAFRCGFPDPPGGQGKAS